MLTLCIWIRTRLLLYTPNSRSLAPSLRNGLEPTVEEMAMLADVAVAEPMVLETTEKVVGLVESMDSETPVVVGSAAEWVGSTESEKWAVVELVESTDSETPVVVGLVAEWVVPTDSETPVVVGLVVGLVESMDLETPVVVGLAVGIRAVEAKAATNSQTSRSFPDDLGTRCPCTASAGHSKRLSPDTLQSRRAWRRFRSRHVNERGFVCRHTYVSSLTQRTGFSGGGEACIGPATLSW